MTNKYIDYLTVDEYKFIQSQLLKRVNEERTLLDNCNKENTKEYAKLRFMELKIKSIISKHQKKDKNTIDTKQYV
jgi:hypothetical protein